MANMKNTFKVRWSLRRQEAMAGYVSIAPWFFGFLVFTAVPMIASFYFSMTKWGLIDTPQFIGLGNYQKLFSDPLVWHSLWVTTKYTFTSVPGRLILALFVALLLVQPIKGTNLMRTIYFIPAVVGGVPIAMLWMWMLNADYGIVNYLLSLVGLNGVAWLSDPNIALWSLVLISCWYIGNSMVILVAGLQNISPQLYEAAELDGANPIAKFRHITLPMLSPTLFFLLVSSMIASFQAFDSAYVITAGGPVRSTLFYLLYFYQSGFRFLNMGYASAMVWLLFLIIILLTILIFRSSSLWVFYESEVKE